MDDRNGLEPRCWWWASVEAPSWAPGEGGAVEGVTCAMYSLEVKWDLKRMEKRQSGRVKREAGRPLDQISNVIINVTWLTALERRWQGDNGKAQVLGKSEWNVSAFLCTCFSTFAFSLPIFCQLILFWELIICLAKTVLNKFWYLDFYQSVSCIWITIFFWNTFNPFVTWWIQKMPYNFVPVQIHIETKSCYQFSNIDLILDTSALKHTVIWFFFYFTGAWISKNRKKRNQSVG